MNLNIDCWVDFESEEFILPDGKGDYVKIGKKEIVEEMKKKGWKFRECGEYCGQSFFTKRIGCKEVQVPYVAVVCSEFYTFDRTLREIINDLQGRLVSSWAYQAFLPDKETE